MKRVDTLSSQNESLKHDIKELNDGINLVKEYVDEKVAEVATKSDETNRLAVYNNENLRELNRFLSEKKNEDLRV